MATFTVWKFHDAEGALAKLGELQREDLIRVVDAAIVTWPEGEKRPKTRQLHDVVGAGAMSGALWGLLFGLLFFMPFLGAAIGAVSGALAGSLADVSIDDDFIAKTREKVTPVSSALFVLPTDAVQDRVLEAFKGIYMELLHTNLSSAQEARLREAFTEND